MNTNFLKRYIFYPYKSNLDINHMQFLKQKKLCIKFISNQEKSSSNGTNSSSIY